MCHILNFDKTKQSCMSFNTSHLHRVQKQRASRSEDAVEHLNAQLMERDTHIADINTQLSDLQAHYDKLGKEKAQTITEHNTLKT